MLARLETLHGTVEAARLPALIAEIFDGLVVQKAVDGFRARIHVRLDIFAADRDALLAEEETEPGVNHDHDEHDRDHHPSEIEAEQQADEQNLQNCREKVQRAHADDEVDCELAAIQHARQAAGFALKMKAQREIVDVAEGLGREHARGVLPDMREKHVAQLDEADHRNARDPVGDDQGEGNSRDLDRLARRIGLGKRSERVHGRFIGQRHRNRDNLRRDQRHRSQNQPHLQIRPSFRPHKGKQILKDGDVLLSRSFRGGCVMGNGAMTQKMPR